MANLLAFPHECELKEEYYGWRCQVPGCSVFYPFGSEPWAPDSEEAISDDD